MLTDSLPVWRVTELLVGMGRFDSRQFSNLVILAMKRKTNS
jgi:hypothetical protein